jgi:hypothetical protein
MEVRADNLFIPNSANVTTGLKCAPLIGAKRAMMMPSVKTVEIVLISN